MTFCKRAKFRYGDRVPQALGVIAACFGIFALLGWITELPFFTAFGPERRPMAPSSALLFMAYGIALFLRGRGSTSPKSRLACVALALFGVIASGLLLPLSLHGVHISVEHLGLDIDGMMAGAPVGHMSPLTAFCLLIFGIAFVLLITAPPGRSARVITSFALAVLVLSIGMILTIAYFLGGPLLYGSGIIPPALTTSLAFLTLSLALLLKSAQTVWPRDNHPDASSVKVAYTLVLIFALAAVGIIAAGYLSFRDYHKLFRAEVEHQLSSIADLKISELTQWRKERLGDAAVFFDNDSFSRLVKQYFEEPSDKQARSRLEIWLEKVQAAYDYDKVFLLDAQGVGRLFVPETGDQVDRRVIRGAFEVMKSGRIALIDFYRESPQGPIRLAALTPIFDRSDNGSALGVLCLSIDPQTYLYPLIMRWPTYSQTAETLLVRREGDDVLFLNELRFQNNTALTLRFSRDAQNLPAMRAVLGHQGVMEGIDYHGMPVVAFTRAVPNSPWSLVARMDAAEVYAPLQERLWETLGLIAALLVGAAAIAGLLWRNQSIRYYRERYEAAEALRESEARYKDLYENAPDMYFSVDPSTTILTRCNQTLAAETGYDKNEIQRRSMFDLYHPDCVERAKETFRSLVSQEVLEEAELQLRRKDGGVIDVSLNASANRDEAGAIVQYRCSWRDITERRQAERRIERLNSILRAIRNVNQLIVREKDREQLIRQAGNLLVESRRYAGVVFALTDENDHPDVYAIAGMEKGYQSLAEKFDQGETPSCFHEACHEEGVLLVSEHDGLCMTCPTAATCAPMEIMCALLIHEGVKFGYALVAVEGTPGLDDEERELFHEVAGDIAYALNVMTTNAAVEQAEQTRRSLENQLLQSQKMEAIGRLAGGVAHDFNNMLQTILGYSDLALDMTDSNHPFREFLEEIQKAALRSAELTRQLLAFSRKQTIDPMILDLNGTIASMLKMLGRLIGEDIDLLWKPSQNLWPVKMDPAQLDQILANLVVNARDAISGGGKITIETGMAEFDEAYCETHVGFVPGRYVMLAVSDDGEGIDRQTLELIFEPFFTTKPRGEGTGLGLATVYGIVKQNNGFINVYSELGKGTTFRIYLSAHEAETLVESKRGLATRPTGTETVLVVEDEEALLNLSDQMLKQLGYTVLLANSPVKAIQLAEEYAGDIHLLLTDVVLPEMSGRELCERLWGKRSGLKCLYMSGYTANVITHHGVLDQGCHFIQKPFSREDLARKMREALET